jgi:DNA-binding response OmpR family regulator
MAKDKAPGATGSALFQSSARMWVLLDLALPDLPGDLVLECLRASDPHIPVVMVTANTDPALARYTLARGAFDYVEKRFVVRRLAHVLEAALARRG